MGYVMKNVYIEFPEFGLYADVDVERRTVTVNFDDTAVTYEYLEILSKAFGTKSINLRSETRNIGGCETCDYEYTATVVEISSVTTIPGEDEALR